MIILPCPSRPKSFLNANKAFLNPLKTVKSDGPLKITSPSPLDQVRTARLSPTTSKSYSSTAPLKTPDLRTPDEYWICCPCGTILLFADPDWALKRAPWLDPWALLVVYCCERYAICKWNLLIRSQNPFISSKICLFYWNRNFPFVLFLIPSLYLLPFLIPFLSTQQKYSPPFNFPNIHL